MSLSKKRIQNKIEIVGEYKRIQIRYLDQIIEDNQVISEKAYRVAIECGEYDIASEHNVEEIAKIVWTSDIVKEYKKSIKPIE